MRLPAAIKRASAYTLGLTLLVGGGAWVYAFNTADGSRWRNAQAIINVGITGTAPAGISWNTAFIDAMKQWTEQTAFTFVAEPAYVDPCVGYSRTGDGKGFPVGGGDFRNGVDFRADVCGNDFGSNVVAITLSRMQAGNLGYDHIVQSDIVFNSSVNWDIYDGQPRSMLDFRRTALHELGHVLGLGHETEKPAIMAPRISAISTLQPDDKAGADSLYGLAGNCPQRLLPLNAARSGNLGTGSCRILDLLASSNDNSFVDVYRFSVQTRTTLQLRMSSAVLDSVLLVFRLAPLNQLEVFDDTNDSCDAAGAITLDPGDYLLLANTYTTPFKCGGNTGAYSLSITASDLPLQGPARRTAAGNPATEALIIGGANTGTGTPYRSNFTALESIDVAARVYPESGHVGRQGRLHVLAVLGDGRQFMQLANGEFVPFNGNMATLAARREGVLQQAEALAIATALQGQASGLAGQQIGVYAGYSVATEPGVIYYANDPIRVSIGQK
jgi:hypothetical protein